MMRAMESSGADPAAELADELRGAIEELSSVAHDPERVAQAVTMAAELRTFLDGPKSPRWYEAGRVDGQLDEVLSLIHI